MNTGKKYKTRQRESILQCIRNHGDSYVTIQEIANYLEKDGEKVGLATIYRNLDKLVTEQQIAKVNIDGIAGVCYRYLPEKHDSILFYMKCEECGEMIHIECPELGKLYSHVSEEHHIWINSGKTMFYGICEQCRNSL